jgi:hypothetical protein
VTECNTTDSLDDIIKQSKESIEKSYCSKLDTDAVRIIDPDSINSNIVIEDATCLFKLKELVYSQEEGLTDKIATVFNAMNMCEATFIAMFECKNGKVTVYIGVVNKKNYENPYYLLTLKNILETGIQGNLPGTELEEIRKAADVKKKIASMLGKGFDTQCISSISSSIDDLRDGDFCYGIDNIINSMGENSFTILIIADSVSKDQIVNMRFGYEELSTQLSAFLNSSITVQKSESESHSTSSSESMSKSIAHSITLTESHTESSGWSANESSRKASDKAMALASSTLIPGGGYMYSVLKGSGSNSTSGGMQEGKTQGETKGRVQGYSSQEGTSEGQTSSYGQSVQYSVQNKTVKNLYEKVEKALNSINECDNYGMFSCCTYILSNNPATNKIISGHYQSMLRTAGKSANTYGINTWTQDNCVEHIRKYLCKFMHPQFRYESRIIEPSVPISGRQLVLHTAFPHKAVPGLPVIEYASFGRNVVRHGALSNDRIAKIGKIYHLGKTENENPVYLDMQSLASHTFITGTNGSGKTNTVYKIIEEIYKNKVKFLVIEPAKGEYKNAFGHYKDVHVYGTNPHKTPLLKINPFKFNDEIHVLEHIDKLIEVFNACWPMYAAMPAVLKAAVENSYISCGWNIKTSECEGEHRIFPTIHDVLKELTRELDSSAFSGEVKGNYVGALTTRLESLCKGLFGLIFSGEDIGDEKLFEENVIIDLSRAFSTETKSILMGLLILRLQEHRMRTAGMNSALRHVTILEEAHHLLRRTSSQQSQDGANVLGKSVEMIANSIAEMRTYGEGFIVLDQSPGLLDMSVIRNTNTKILLRLPDMGDRELVGRSMGLWDCQIAEIPHLKKGVCVIYQNDWLEAVLCHIDKSENSNDSLVFKYDEQLRNNVYNDEIIPVVKYLIALSDGNACKDSDSYGKVCEWICSSSYSAEEKKDLLAGILSPKSRWRTVARIISDIACPSDILTDFSVCTSKEAMQLRLEGIFEINLSELLQREIDLLIESILWYKKQGNKALDKAYKEWFVWCDNIHAENICTDESNLLKARGCGMKILLANMTLEKLPEKDECAQAAAVLKNSKNPVDIMLTGILEQYSDKELVMEWSDLKKRLGICYYLISAQKILEGIEDSDVDEWHIAAVNHMKKYVSTDRITELSILNSALLYESKNQKVRMFYMKWFRKYAFNIICSRVPGNKIHALVSGGENI